MSHTSDVLTAFLGSTARLGSGLFARKGTSKPPKPLDLYEFEACPYCRKVRDALSELGLEARIYPCPKGGTRFRPQVEEMGGKAQFPYLADPNTGRQMYESNEIIDYLFEQYGAGARPGARLRLAGVTDLTSFLASAVRPRRGARARPSKEAPKPLELYGFEASPFCRLVRETLCELELPYLLHNVAKGRRRDLFPTSVRQSRWPEEHPSTASREAFVARSGQMMVPYLADPNTGTEMFESQKICAYLEETYGE